MFEFVLLLPQQESPLKPVSVRPPALVQVWDGTSEGMSVGALDPAHGGEDAHELHRHGDMPEPAPEKVLPETGRPVLVSGYAPRRPLWSGSVQPHPVW
jgi:hypothetical protein